VSLYLKIKKMETIVLKGDSKSNAKLLLWSNITYRKPSTPTG
jgi:hypothetical protein